jgi:hypothetical protein
LYLALTISGEFLAGKFANMKVPQFKRQENQTMKKPVAAKKVIAGFSAERRSRIKARAKELIATEMALGDIRKSRALTQEQVANKSTSPASKAAAM